MDIKECFDRRLLVKIPKDIEKAKRSLEIAQSKLIEAQNLSHSNFYNFSVISAYMSMFHSARAILYSEGIQEKSHYAIFVYLNEKYYDKIPKNLLISFNNYREERHEALYGFDYSASLKDAESACSDAKDFLSKVKELLR